MPPTGTVWAEPVSLLMSVAGIFPLSARYRERNVFTPAPLTQMTELRDRIDLARKQAQPRSPLPQFEYEPATMRTNSQQLTPIFSMHSIQLELELQWNSGLVGGS